MITRGIRTKGIRIVWGIPDEIKKIHGIPEGKPYHIFLHTDSYATVEIMGENPAKQGLEHLIRIADDGSWHLFTGSVTRSKDLRKESSHETNGSGTETTRTEPGRD